MLLKRITLGVNIIAEIYQIQVVDDKHSGFWILTTLFKMIDILHHSFIPES